MAANRIPENSGELPVRTFVITRDEIAANGFTTLVDVLKTLPGFHTSQPGSADLGETFLQRGLLGNVYTKIMINSVPITPSAAPGMPLGAQLPIKQAERIEIILGPASTLYGNDAMAGVINIVLPEADRPVSAMGNVAAGTNGLTEVHLSLGGMLGKRKNVVKYNFFGSTRRMKNMNMYVPWGDTLYLMDVDSLEELGRRIPKEDSLYPDIENFGHESRLIGVSIDYRGLKLTAMGMSREDHSALGSHPDNVAYHDPNTTTSDAIYNFSAQYRNEFQLGKKKRTAATLDETGSMEAAKKKREYRLFMFSSLSWNNYEIDEHSSYEALLHPMVFDRNFIYAQSDDVLFEQLFNFNLNNKVNLMAGGSYSYKRGTPYFNYFGRPFEESDTIPNTMNGDAGYSTSADDMGGGGMQGDESSLLTQWVPREGYEATDWGVFSQVYIRTKWVNLIGGVRMDMTGALRETENSTNILGDSAYLIPSFKLGATIKLHPRFRLRGVYSKSFRRPGSYYFYNNYVQSARMNSGDDFQPFIRTPADLTLESLKNFEGGFTWDVTDDLTFEGHYYFHKRYNSLFPVIGYKGRLEEYTGVEDPDTIGFTNYESLSLLGGLQAFLSYNKGPVRFDIGAQLNQGEEFIDEVDTLSDGYRGVPTWMAKANLHLNFKKVGRITINSRLVGPYVGQLIEENEEVFRQDIPGFYSVGPHPEQNFCQQAPGLREDHQSHQLPPLHQLEILRSGQ